MISMLIRRRINILAPTVDHPDRCSSSSLPRILTVEIYGSGEENNRHEKLVAGFLGHIIVLSSQP